MDTPKPTPTPWTPMTPEQRERMKADERARWEAQFGAAAKQREAVRAAKAERMARFLEAHDES